MSQGHQQEQLPEAFNPRLLPVDPQVISKIERIFQNYVVPDNVLTLFQKYYPHVLVDSDKEQIRLDTQHRGNRAGAITLLDRLRRYQDWFDCLRCTLRDAGVKQEHVAELIEQAAGVGTGEDRDGIKLRKVLELQEKIRSLEMQLEENETENKEQAEQHKQILEDIKKEHGEERQHLMAENSKLQETVEKKDKDLEAALKDVSRWKEQAEQHKQVLEDIKKEHGEERQHLMAENSKLQETVEKTEKDLEAALKDVSRWKDRQQTESRQSVGFIAELPTGQTIFVTRHSTLRCLTEVTMDTGHQYVPSTGVFTVSVSGWYKVTLRHNQERGDSKGFIELGVMHESGEVGVGQGEEHMVCGTMTHGSRYRYGGRTSKVQASSEKVVQLGVGDRLWVKVMRVVSDEKLVSPTCVSCVLLND